MSYPVLHQFKLPKLEVFLLIMAALASLIAWAPQNYFEWERHINPTNFKAMLSGDHYTGGNSIPSWVEEDKHLWECSSGDNPPRYCTYSLDLRDARGEGISLSRFNYMDLSLFYRGPAKTIKITLRNATEPYFDTSNWTSTQYNQIDVPIDRLENGFEASREVFTVANWWLAQKKVGEKSTKPEFGNVMFLEVQVGGQSTGDTHLVQLLDVGWRGSRFSTEQVYRGLIIGWVLLIIIILIARYLKLRANLNREKKSQEELIELNLALELQNREFSEIARTDRLTGLLNRLGLRDKIYESLATWEKDNTQLSIVMIDLDHFKQINDTYGHDIGDKVIQQAARVLSSNTRSTDLIARWGGEEFVLFCHNTNVDAVQLIAEGLREKIAKISVIPELSLSASFGVASGDTKSFRELHKLADKALYQAKSEGRNKVCVYRPDFAMAQ